MIATFRNTLIRIAVSPCHCVLPTPAGPIFMDLDDPEVVFRAAERDQHLVQDHPVPDGESRLDDIRFG